MAKRQRHTPEQVISKFREAEVQLAKGAAIARVCKDPAIDEDTYDRWRREYGGMKVDQARRLKELGRANARLKRLPADAELDKAILKEAATAARDPEGPRSAAGAGPFAAQRWLVRPPEAGASRSRLELRLRPGPDT